MFPTNSTDTAAKSEFWRRQLEEFKQYSGSQTQFSRERGFCPHLLHYWRKKLSGYRRNRQPKEIVSVSPFIPVSVGRVTVSAAARSSSLPNAKWLAEFILHLHARGEV